MTTACFVCIGRCAKLILDVCADCGCMQTHDLVANLLFNAIAEGMRVQKHVGESKFCTSRYSMKLHYCLPLMIRLLVELPGHSTPTSLE